MKLLFNLSRSIAAKAQKPQSWLQTSMPRYLSAYLLIARTLLERYAALGHSLSSVPRTHRWTILILYHNSSSVGLGVRDLVIFEISHVYRIHHTGCDANAIMLDCRLVNR